MKNLPKGMLFFIALILLILIPLILSILIVGGILKLGSKGIAALLPFQKKKTIGKPASNNPITIDITPKN